MNNKKRLLVLAMSLSFVFGANSIAHADEVKDKEVNISQENASFDSSDTKNKEELTENKVEASNDANKKGGGKEELGDTSEESPLNKDLEALKDQGNKQLMADVGVDKKSIDSNQPSKVQPVGTDGSATPTDTPKNKIEVELPYTTNIYYSMDDNLGEEKTREGTKGKAIYVAKVDAQGNPYIEEEKRPRINSKTGEPRRDKEGNILYYSGHYENPKSKTITIGTKKVTDVPLEFNTEYELDDSMDYNSVQVKRDGEKGNRQITTAYGFSNKTKHNEYVEKIEDTKKAVNKLVKIGTKTTGVLEHEVEEIVPFETEIIENDQLVAGTWNEKVKGVNGKKTYKYTQNIINSKADGNLVRTLLNETFATKRVIEIGTKPATKETEIKKDIDVTVKYVEDKNLSKGEVQTQTIEKGKVNAKVSDTYNPKTGDISTKVDPDESTNATVTVKYGTKDFTGETSHEVTEEIPYKVVIEEDPTMIAGTSKIETQGIAGSKTTKYIQKIKNGQADGQVQAEEVKDKYKAPINQVIKVGTKPAQNDENKTSDVSVDIEYVYDKTKEKGVVEKGEFTSGKVVTKIENKYNPTTGKIETTTTQNVISAKQKIIVGTKDFTAEYKYTEVEKIPFETELVFDNSLKAGEKQVSQKGELGEKSREITQRFINGKDDGKTEGDFAETKAPVKQIIKVGTMTNQTYVHKESLPFNTIVELNKELKKGEWRYKLVDGVEQKGKLGTRTTEWTIKNSIVENHPKITDEKPVDAIIEVGSADFTGTVTNKVKEEIPFNVRILENPDLEVGESKIKQVGKVGSREVEYSAEIVNGKLKEGTGFTRKEVENSTIEALDQIIEIGTKSIVREEKIPFGKIYKHNPKLEAGKVIEISKGKDGAIKTTIRFDKDKGKNVTDVVRTEPVDEVYEYGSKTEGEIKLTSEIPYEVEIKKDNTLAEGTYKIEQEGIVGEKETTITIENSKEKNRSEKIVKKAVNKIIVIGTKNMCRNPEPPKKTEVPSKPKSPEKPPVANGEKIKTQELTRVPKIEVQRPRTQKPIEEKRNPKTGIAGVSGVISTTVASLLGLGITKKKEK